MAGGDCVLLPIHKVIDCHRATIFLFLGGSREFYLRGELVASMVVFQTDSQQKKNGKTPILRTMMEMAI